MTAPVPDEVLRALANMDDAAHAEADDGGAYVAALAREVLALRTALRLVCSTYGDQHEHAIDEAFALLPAPQPATPS